MLKIYNESDFELYFKETARVAFLKRFVSKKSPYDLAFVKKTFFFFQFCNILDLENVYIERFFLLLWLSTSLTKNCLIYKLKSKLRLGKYYFNFIVKCTLSMRQFLHFLSFLLDDLVDNSYNSLTLKQNNNKQSLFCLNNLNVFTNKKLARGVYFYRINKKLFLTVYWHNHNKKSLLIVKAVILNILKLYV